MMRMETPGREVEAEETALPLRPFPGPGVIPWHHQARPPLPGSGPRADVTTGPDYRRACPAQRLCNAVLGFFVSFFFPLKVLISQGKAQPNASKKGRPGGLGCV